jgi:hypothetical protein
MSLIGSWRIKAGLVKNPVYKRKFAFIPKLCADGTRVWFRMYYDKYEIWKYPGGPGHEFGHKDFIESITEEEYIVRKLAETL